MNRELLPQEEYYRPQRAAEWRKKAERLEWWQVRLSHAVPPLACGLLLLAVAPLFVGLELSLALLGYAAPLLLGFLVLPFLLRENDASYRRHADALEAEHAARYGAPTSGGEAGPMPVVSERSGGRETKHYVPTEPLLRALETAEQPSDERPRSRVQVPLETRYSQLAVRLERQRGRDPFRPLPGG